MSEDFTADGERKIAIRPRKMAKRERKPNEEPISDEELEDESPLMGGVEKTKTGGKILSGPLPSEFARRSDGAPETKADPPSPEAPDEVVSENSQRKRVKRTGSFLSGIRALVLSVPRWKIGVVPLAILGIPLLVWLWGMAHRSGVATGMREANRAAEMDGLQLPPDVSLQLDAALMDLRAGDATAAEKTLIQLDEGEAKYPSLSYLVALAAMQNGNIPLAERKVKESIIKRERISDALGLQSVLEAQKAADPSLIKMGDSKKRSEALLRQAILADAANPYPHFELATLLRYQGRRDEAMQEIKAAKARLNPVDSHLLMDITLSFMDIETMPQEQIPRDPPQSDDIRKVFPAAYAAMRLGNFSQAANLLQQCRDSLSADLFDYLVNDPLLRKFSQTEELKRFYEY